MLTSIYADAGVHLLRTRLCVRGIANMNHDSGESVLLIVIQKHFKNTHKFKNIQKFKYYVYTSRFNYIRPCNKEEHECDISSEVQAYHA